MSCTGVGDSYHCRDFVTWQTMSFQAIRENFRVYLTIGTNREFVVYKSHIFNPEPLLIIIFNGPSGITNM